MVQINFIILLLAILVISYLFDRMENFVSNENVGLYNYFFQSYMNPYPLPLNKFFSNDKEGTPNE
jgi:hypothetical protein